MRAVGPARGARDTVLVPSEARRSYPGLTARSADIRAAAVEQLAAEVGPAASAALTWLLTDVASKVRWTALNALGTFGGRLARVAARAAVADPMHHVRRSALELLCEAGTQQDLPWILPALDDADWVIRSDAVLALGGVGGRRARNALVTRGLTDPHQVVRRDAAGCLAALQHVSAVPALTRALAGEREPLARVGIVAALCELGEDHLLPELLTLLADPDFLVRENVLHSVHPAALPEAARSALMGAVRRLRETETHPGVLAALDEFLNDAPAERD